MEPAYGYVGKKIRFLRRKRIGVDILETNLGETAVHAGIESITALLAVGAEAPGGDRLRSARWLSPREIEQWDNLVIIHYLRKITFWKW